MSVAEATWSVVLGFWVALENWRTTIYRLCWTENYLSHGVRGQ